MTSAPADPLIGQTLDARYVLRSRIARGGMAMVYLASDLRLERRVAVKMMHEHLTDDENFTRRFEQEARSAARLSHPNVVNVFDQGHDAGRPYLVMEYLPGITLRDLLKQQQRLTAEQALEIGEAVLSGLASAHRAGIVHRDVKPENVLLADDGRIKIGDFGLARAAGANTTTGQALLGTIAYLSPELVTRGIADARSDVYAFGIMMFEMLTGAQPFRGEQPMQIAYQHANSDVPPPSSQTAESTPELDEFVRWTTQRDPETRPRDAVVVLDQLHRIKGRDTAPGGATKVLPISDLEEPGATTVLQEDVAGGAGAAGPAPDRAPEGDAGVGPTSIDLAAQAARTRSSRGRLAAVLVLLCAVAIGGVAWWFGQGPGSKVAVPDVSGQEISAVQESFAALPLDVEVFECSSVDVEAGRAVRTEPETGARVERESTVRVCQSTGPEMLPVPTLVGLSADDAEQAIDDAGFAFGDVAEERFSEEEAGTVLAALDQNGDGLGETYPEQGDVDLVVSAGPLPSLSDVSVEEATRTLADAGLTVAPGNNTEAHSEDVKKGRVIGVVFVTDPVRPGDEVGLQTSLGPELFEVPDVSDARYVSDAMKILSDAGFEPKVRSIIPIPEALLRRISFDDIDPEEGTMLPRGSEIEIIIN